jgi:acetamidase/formamidase
MYGPGGRVPLRPMCGTIGVAPAAPGLHSIIPPRNVGRNMDVRDISEGVELYLPIEVDGAIFSVGDTHAARGDGEVCGTAIETAIDVDLKFELVKGANLRSPRYVTLGPVTNHFDKKGYEVTTGIGPDLMVCARTAVSEMVELLSRRFGYSPIDAYMLCKCVRGSAHQLDRRRAELGGFVLLSEGRSRIAAPEPNASLRHLQTPVIKRASRLARSNAIKWLGTLR